MVDMLNAGEVVDQLDDSYSVEFLTTALSQPTLDKARDLRLWETEAGQLVGIGWLRLENPRSMGYSTVLWSSVSTPTSAVFTSKIPSWTGPSVAPKKQAKSATCPRVYYRAPPPIRHALFPCAAGNAGGSLHVPYAPIFRAPIPEPQLPVGFTLRHSSGEGQDVEKSG